MPTAGLGSPKLASETAMFKRNMDGTVQRIPGDTDFNTVLTGDMRGSIPGNYTMTRPTTTPTKRTLQNIYHARAREGFKYWYQERPKPTSCKLNNSEYMIT